MRTNRFRMKNIIITLILLTLMACSDKEQRTTEETKEISEMPSPTVQKSSFGMLTDGTIIDLYTLKNAAGMKVNIITYGGIVQSIEVPDKDGNWGDIVLGHDHIDGYLDESQKSILWWNHWALWESDSKGTI